MKWGIIVLLILGLIAAICAAILVGALKLDTFTKKNVEATDPETVDVLVASRNLPALTVMTADCFVTKKVPKTELKEKDRPYKVAETLGSVNIQPMVEGQMLTESCFGWGGTGPEIIAKLAPGMYAYTIHMSRQTLPDPTFLYPGCVVDVLHIDKLDRSMGGYSISQTLLERVRIMAVSGRTQMRAVNPDEKDTQSSSRRSGGTVAVTLEVSYKQAQALALAKGSGTMSLAVRSPNDTTEADKEAMMLVEGQLARYTPADLANEPNKSSTNIQDPNNKNQRTRIFNPIRPEQDRSREVIIHKGAKKITEKFEAHKNENSGESNDQK